MARADRRFGRSVAQNIKFGLLVADALQTAEEIVGVEDGESASALRQGGEDLLIGGGQGRYRRHDGSR